MLKNGVLYLEIVRIYTLVKVIYIIKLLFNIMIIVYKVFKFLELDKLTLSYMVLLPHQQ